jgi:4'-phosphopantetheinyl transferase
MESHGNIEISGSEADVWYMGVARDFPVDLIRSCDSVLTPSEKAEAKRFRLREDECQFILTRAVLKGLLSRYLSVGCRELKIKRDVWGRAVLSGNGSGAVFFSVTHTKGFSAWIMSGEQCVGIDVESAKREVNLQFLEGVLSDTELHAIQRIRESLRNRRALEYWILKEALAKARGKGLEDSLGKHSFDISEGKDEAGGRTARLLSEPDRWHFELISIDEAYLLAAAVRKRKVDQPRFKFCPLSTADVMILF